MTHIGCFNSLTVLGKQDNGFLLDGDALGVVLLAAREVTDSLQVGDSIRVFVYLDSKDRPVATLQQPLIEVGKFAWLKVADVTKVGAFLDWGLPKDLLLPFAEQKYTAEVGKRVMVRAYVDNTQRIAASTRIDDFLEEQSEGFTVGQQVSLLIADKTDLGYKAIIDNTHWGIIFHNELFQTVKKGQEIDGYIKWIRDDGKIDLSLRQPGLDGIQGVADLIIENLQQNDGFMMITDKSPPETIYAIFKVSKKIYKKAVGLLYKQRRVAIEPTGIRLLKP